MEGEIVDNVENSDLSNDASTWLDVRVLCVVASCSLGHVHEGVLTNEGVRI